MSRPKTFREIIDLWPTQSAFSRVIGVNRQNVSEWHRRNKIPDRYWRATLEAMRAYGYELDADYLLDVLSDSGYRDPQTRQRRDERTRNKPESA